MVGFYDSNRILVKRVIRLLMDRIAMDAGGNVYVNGEHLNEPYLKEKALGERGLIFPYQVSELCGFVMGDLRENFVDSGSPP